MGTVWGGADHAPANFGGREGVRRGRQMGRRALVLRSFSDEMGLGLGYRRFAEGGVDGWFLRVKVPGMAIYNAMRMHLRYSVL